MKANIKNIYRLRAYMQVHRILYLMMMVKAVTSYGLREKESNRTRMHEKTSSKKIVLSSEYTVQSTEPELSIISYVSVGSNLWGQIFRIDKDIRGRDKKRTGN